MVRRDKAIEPTGAAQSAKQAVVELRHVTRRFGGVIAVADASLTLQTGEVAAVLGPNGAGKTTLIKLMLGLLRPSAGEVRLFGLHPQSPAARERIGVMLQASGVPETLTVGELRSPSLRLAPSASASPVTSTICWDTASRSSL